MKITAIKKNHDEKGSRAEFWGSNAHSNGGLFSRSSLIFFEISVAGVIMADDSRSRMVIVAVYLRTVQRTHTNKYPLIYPATSPQAHVF